MGRYDSPGRGDCKPQEKGEGGRVGSEGFEVPTEPLVSDLEERLRVADSRVRQLEGMLENEKARRMGAEADADRLTELQEENARLLRNEEELLLLVLDMEAQIERLSA